MCHCPVVYTLPDLQMLCHTCAIALHYFFLSTFLWLMNEAFNLYILITYAAHAHGEQAEGGSDWRYYLLGWGEYQWKVW